MFVMCSVSNVQLLNLFSRLFSSLKGKAKVAGIISVNRGYNGNGWHAHEVYCVYMGAFCLFSAWKPKREEMKFVLWHLSKRLCVCVVLWTDEQHIILHFSSVDCVCLPLPPGNDYYHTFGVNWNSIFTRENNHVFFFFLFYSKFGECVKQTRRETQDKKYHLFVPFSILNNIRRNIYKGNIEIKTENSNKYYSIIFFLPIAILSGLTLVVLCVCVCALFFVMFFFL